MKAPFLLLSPAGGLAVLCMLLAICMAAWSQPPANAPGEPGEATIEVNPEAGIRPLPRTVFGTFLEPIGRGIYGGLWAQVLENSSFEDGLWSAGVITRMLERQPDLRRASEMGLPLPWQPLRDDQAIRYEPRRADAVNGYSSLYVMALPGRETGIRQEVYLPVHRTLRYTGSFYARHESGSGAVEVSIRRRNKPNEVLARAAVDLSGDKWRRYEYALDLPAGSVAPLEAVDFAIALHDGGRALLDQIFLYPADHVDGMDPDVVALTKASHPSVIRYGGNFTSGYHWRDGVGPMDERVPMLNQSWGIPEYNQFGTDEFLRFCELVGAVPDIAVNLGSGTPQEAADWVRYVLGKWRGGTPFWELGNELWGAGWQIGYPTIDEVAGRTEAYSRAIRKVDPKARLIATGQDPDHFREWNAQLLKLEPGTFNYLATHFVVGTADVRKPDASSEFVAESAFAMPVGLERDLRQMQEQVDADPRWRGKAQAAFTEWLYHGSRERAPEAGNMGGAVCTGGMLNGLMRTSDFVPVSTMTGTIEFHGLRKARGRAYGTPSYWAFRMYASADASRLVETRTSGATYDVREGNGRVPDIPNVPYLDIVGALNEAGDTLTLFCVNRHLTQPIAARIRAGAFLRGTGQELRADTIYEANDEERPEAVTPHAVAPSSGGDGLSYTFSPASVTVLTLKKG